MIKHFKTFILDEKGPCKVLTVTLRNDALKLWSHFKGRYQLSQNYNGKPKWTSISNDAISHDPWGFVCIGSKNYIGKHTCAIVRMFDGTWKYSDPESWTGWTRISTANDVQIKCLNEVFSDDEVFL